MIRKEGKARWTYTCKLCRKTWTKPDHFRAIERRQQHLGSMSHMVEGLSAAFRPLGDAFRDLGLAWGIVTPDQARAMILPNYGLAPRRHLGNADGA